MDFNAIYEAIAPYFGTGAIATAIVTIISLAVKVANVIKDIRKESKSTHSEAIEAFKQAIPKELYVSIESLAKTEFESIKNELLKEFTENFIEPIRQNTELCQAIAKALMVNKTIPDSLKVQIADLLNEEKPNTVESLKVELIPDEKPQEIGANIVIE